MRLSSISMALAAVACALTAPAPARAQPQPQPIVAHEWRDDPPRGPDPGATLTARFQVLRGDMRSDWGTTVQLVVPTDRWLYGAGWAASPTRAKTDPHSKHHASRKEHPADDRSATADDERARPPARSSRHTPRGPRLTAADLQRALTAAFGERPGSEDVKALRSYARWSAALPRLQLRATRLLDESASLSPTSYDPHRTTNRGGVSLWLEARTSWDLDRLLFAAEEVALVRLQRTIEHSHQQQRDALVALLLAWQRATWVARDPTSSHRECSEAQLDRMELALRIDLITRGWLSERQRRDGPLDVDCDPDALGIEALSTDAP